jgi:hypothetical protein
MNKQTVALIASFAGWILIANATTYEDIAGQWCGDVTEYVFAPPSRRKIHFRDGRHSTSGGPPINLPVWEQGRTAMKALLVGVAFAIVIIFTSQAFAAELPDCPNVQWRHGHYICDEANS